jgi:parallel beta-helix repeat protein
MKTLVEVEPRTAISSLPMTITESGSYYLTENLTLSTTEQDGILVAVDNVTIDLNGFTLSGPGKAAGTSGAGIIGSSVGNIVVRNGIIREWRGNGIELSSSCNRIAAVDLIAENNGGYGVELGNTGIVRNVISRENGECGIQVTERAIVENCTVTENGYHGIYIGNRTTVRNCSVFLNTYEGIVGFSNNIIKNNTIANNRQGINVSARNLITHNSSCSNSEDGIQLNNNCNQVMHNLVTNNSEHGISVSGDYNRIAHNTISYNRNISTPTKAGIYLNAISNGSHIEGNMLCNNNYGIDVSVASDNLIVGNRAYSNDSDYLMGGTANSYGTIVNESGGGTLSTSDPYANIHH